jgi:hypothetical protein
VKSVPAARRLSAVVALLAPAAVLAVAVVVLVWRPLLLLLAAQVCLGAAVGAGADAVTRTGAHRARPAG